LVIAAQKTQPYGRISAHLQGLKQVTFVDVNIDSNVPAAETNRMFGARLRTETGTVAGNDAAGCVCSGASLRLSKKARARPGLFVVIDQ
jgi:hypothetical protein